MILLIVLVRIALSVIFGGAGVTKLLDLRGTREAVKNFGAPESLVPALSILLPIVELAIAAGLLFVATTPASAFAAVLVLALFIVAISVNLAQGRKHDCHCFGQIYSRPLGWPTLVRNLIFALGAGLILDSRTHVPASSCDTSHTYFTAWLLFIGAVPTSESSCLSGPSSKKSPPLPASRNTLTA